MSVFNQQNQKVTHQTNIAGDAINMSGNFSGAILNIKSTLNNVTQTINAHPADDSLKAELNKLIGQLDAELEKAPPDREEDAAAVAETAQTLIEKAAAEKPNKALLKITAEGLKQAAQNIAGVMPAVLGIATQIAAAALKLAG